MRAPDDPLTVLIIACGHLHALPLILKAGELTGCVAEILKAFVLALQMVSSPSVLNAASFVHSYPNPSHSPPSLAVPSQRGKARGLQAQHISADNSANLGSRLELSTAVVLQPTQRRPQTQSQSMRN